MQAFIASLVGELSLQWINPGHHRVCLFIVSTKSLFHLPTRMDFKVTDVCLHCGDENIYRQSFSVNFPSFSNTETCLGQKLYLGGCTHSWQTQHSIPYAVLSVSYDGLCKHL